MAVIGGLQNYGNLLDGLEILEEEYDEHFEPTEKEILEQCVALGIDPLKEEHLIYIAKEALKAPLPNTWKPVRHQDEIFYFNCDNGESTWEHPCDTYYRNLLQQERERRPSLTLGRRSGSLPGGGVAPPTGSGKPNLPSAPPHMGKPPLLVPIGTLPVDPLASTDLHLGPLPGLKPLKSELREPPPLSLLKPPPLGQPGQFSLSKAPPLSGQSSAHKKPGSIPANTVSESTSVFSPSINGKGSDNITGTHVIGSSVPISSALLVSSLAPPKSRYDMSTDLPIGNLSNQFEEEEEEGLSEEEEERFDKKFNLMGMEDLATPTDIVSDEEETTTDDVGGVNQQKSPTIPSSYFLKSANKSPLQTIATPTNPSPQGSPSLRPGAARGSRTAPPKDPPGGKKRTSPEVLSGVAKLSSMREQADLDRKHHETLERLKQEHSRELEGLRNQYQLELKEEREELEREKDRKISLAREQHKAEYELEKGRLDQQHRERVESMGRSLRAEQEEEEARLHEGKEDALKAIKRKLSCEQQDEEQLLRKGRDEAIAKLKADINKEREEMERGLRGLLETSMSDLRRQLDKEREEERERVKAECVGGVTRYRQQLMEETNKEKADLLKKHEEQLNELRESLTKQHATILEEEKTKLSSEYQQYRRERENQRTSELARIEEEAKKGLEERRIEILAAHDSDLQSMREAHSMELSQVREEQERVMVRVREEGTQERERVKRQQEDELSCLKTEYENSRKELEQEMTDLARDRERMREEREREERERSTHILDREDQTLSKEGPLHTPQTPPQGAGEALRGNREALLGDIASLMEQKHELEKSIETFQELRAHLSRPDHTHLSRPDHTHLYRPDHTRTSRPDHTYLSSPDNTHKSGPSHTHFSSPDHALSRPDHTLMFSNPAALALSKGAESVSMATDSTSSSSEEDDSNTVISDIQGAWSMGVAREQTPVLTMSALDPVGVVTVPRDKGPSPSRSKGNKRMGGVPERRGLSGSNVEDDVWRRVKQQIDQEGEALLKLEQDFNNGPLKRMERIEKMLGSDEETDPLSGPPLSTTGRHGNLLSGDGNMRPRPLPQSRQVYSPHPPPSLSSTGECLLVEDLETPTEYETTPIPHSSVRKPTKVLNSPVKGSHAHYSLEGHAHNTRPDVSQTIHTINGQLNQLLVRLNDMGVECPPPPSNKGAWAGGWSHFDRDLRDNRHPYQDQTAKDEILRTQLGSTVALCDPPVTGLALVQKQKDWLQEFKQSLPITRRSFK